jgi:hypothetical protein
MGNPKWIEPKAYSVKTQDPIIPARDMLLISIAVTNVNIALQNASDRLEEIVDKL